MHASFEPEKQRQNPQKARHESQGAVSYPSRTLVHAKLEMTDPADADEREADAVADKLMNGGKIARKVADGGVAGSGIAVPRQMESRLEQLRGEGMTMPSALRSRMEGGFGQGFENVRLHTDSEAARLSESIGARAFTHGSDIYFNRGQYAPDTVAGQRLVAHELTHVVQGGGKVARLTGEQKAARDDRQYNRMEVIKLDYFDTNRFIIDGDGGLTLCDLLEGLLDEYFFQLLCTETKSFKKLFDVADLKVLYGLLVTFRSSFQTMIQSSWRLFNVLVPAGSKAKEKWDILVDWLQEDGYVDFRNKPVWYKMQPRYWYGDFHSGGKDPGMGLTSDKYHENRITAMRDYVYGDYYEEGDFFNYFDPDQVVQNLMNLNTLDFLEFLYQCVAFGQTELLESITAFGDVPHVEELWDYHSVALSLLMNDQTVFHKVFSSKALAGLTGKTANSYKDYIAREEAKLNKDSSVAAGPDPKEISVSDILAVFNEIVDFLSKGNSAYATIGGVDATEDLRKASLEATKMSKGLTALVSDVRGVLSKYFVESGKSAPKFGKVSAWFGIFTASRDLLKILRVHMPHDIKDFPIATSLLIFCQVCILAGAILNHPSLLGRIAVAHPAIAAAIFFFGVGVSIGDLINTAIDSYKGKTPGAVFFDAIMG